MWRLYCRHMILQSPRPLRSPPPRPLLVVVGGPPASGLRSPAPQASWVATRAYGRLGLPSLVGVLPACWPPLARFSASVTSLTQATRLHSLRDARDSPKIARIHDVDFEQANNYTL